MSVEICQDRNAVITQSRLQQLWYGGLLNGAKHKHLLCISGILVVQRSAAFAAPRYSMDRSVAA